jgi:hypothetical protein
MGAYQNSIAIAEYTIAKGLLGHCIDLPTYEAVYHCGTSRYRSQYSIRYQTTLVSHTSSQYCMVTFDQLRLQNRSSPSASGSSAIAIPKTYQNRRFQVAAS